MPLSHVTRRALLKLGTGVAAGATTLALLPRPLLARLGGPRAEPVPPIQDPKVKELALRAVEASRAAGANYADVRLTYTRERKFYVDVEDREAMHVGVRALVNGYWGFAASPVWTPEEMGRLGQEAVHQAKTNALGKPRPVELAPVPKVADGHWTMPVKYDPFEVSPFEISDLLQSLQAYAGIYLRGVNTGYQVWNTCEFRQQEKAFASTEGSYCTQRLYLSQGLFNIKAIPRPGGPMGTEVGLDFLTPAGVGWELYLDHQPLHEKLRQLVEEIKHDLALPAYPVQVGRYDTVLDAWPMTQVLHGTLGRATELDRALGYEANASGTSYLNDPFAMVGNYQAGAPLLTVLANRSEPGGAATVQWDDEGGGPDTFPLVQDGVLADFQTTRESAGWLKDYYAKAQRPLRSHGCAAAPLGRDAPLTHPANLVLQPGTEAQDFDALVGALKQGIAVKNLGTDPFPGFAQMDFQCLNGRRVGRLLDAGLLFRAPEFWKALMAVGGAASQRRYGLPPSSWEGPIPKGEPPQAMYHSVTAPPAVFKQLTVIDATRKA